MYLLFSVRKGWKFLGLMDNELTEDTLLRSAITSKTFSNVFMSWYVYLLRFIIIFQFVLPRLKQSI